MTATPRVLVLHGPNLSQLGSRDPDVYGTATLDDVVGRVARVLEQHGFRVDATTSEAESALVERAHAARTDATVAVIVNAGALTHTSHALADALELLEVPIVEVHLSNVHARERFRHVSVLARVVTGTIAGFGIDGYDLAARAVVAALDGAASTESPQSPGS